MTIDSPKLVMVGAFPPPVHGMALVNSAVEKALRDLGVAPRIIDLSAKSLDRSIMARLSRLPKVLRGGFAFLRMRNLRDATLYMSVSGGAAQAYEILFALIARFRGMRLFLHHHSYAYIDRRNWLTSWLAFVAGSKAVHVVLSPQMAVRLRTIYSIECTAVVSNAAIFLHNRTSVVAARQKLQTLGFLSNIAPEKGVFEFLDLLDALRDRDLSIKAKLAGPFQDATTEMKVRARLGSMPNVEYVGPKYGTEKDQFFSGIDALIFPSLYINEAEPLTLHEAMISGVPIIAYGRGAIGEIISIDCGRVIDPSKPFVPEALNQVDAWCHDSASFNAASLATLKRFHRTYAENRERWKVLLNDLIDRNGKSLRDHSVSEAK